MSSELMLPILLVGDSLFGYFFSSSSTLPYLEGCPSPEEMRVYLGFWTGYTRASKRAIRKTTTEMLAPAAAMLISTITEGKWGTGNLGMGLQVAGQSEQLHVTPSRVSLQE